MNAHTAPPVTASGTTPITADQDTSSTVPARADRPATTPATASTTAGAPRSIWRVPAAAGAAAMSVAHIPILEEHLATAPVVGVGFALLSIAGILLAILLLTADRPVVWAGTGLVALLALAGYLLSRSVGLPTIGDDIGQWTDPLGILALTGEALMLLCALLAVPAINAARRR